MRDPSESKPRLKTSTPGGSGWRPADEEAPEIRSEISSDYPIIGEVRGFQNRTESKGPQHPTQIIWTFRIERFDASGNRLPLVPIEMRSKSFHGFINEGDRVEVNQPWRDGEVLKINKLRNLTTGSIVTARSAMDWTIVPKIILFLAVFLFIGMIALRMLENKRKLQPVKIKSKSISMNFLQQHDWQNLIVAPSI